MNVICATDVAVYAESLAEFIGRSDDINGSGILSNKQDVVAAVQRDPPDVLLLDAQIPDGVAIVAAVRDLAPNVKTVVIVDIDDDEQIVAFAEAGAVGFISSRASGKEMVEILRSTLRNEVHCPPKITAALLNRLSAVGDIRAVATGKTNQDGHLTAREREILTFIHRGLTNEAIATELCISVSTVKNHVHNILTKLHVSSRTQAVRRLQPFSMVPFKTQKS